ncbi:MAG: hypothetical protein JNM24_11735 [Bdellovibrionaceae bacterium]|nr:hypothetical protein [Pseudobdellovibrionaceae bacterium]
MDNLVFHWERVGRLFPQARLLNIELKFEFQLRSEASFENDINIPIICEDISINRKRIFESLWNALGPRLYFYFYENDNFLSEMVKERSTLKRRHLLNTESAIKALTEVVAFLISETKPPSLGSKSKNLRNDYKKNETQCELESILYKLKEIRKSVRGDAKPNPELIRNLVCTELLKKFLPDVATDLDDFKQTFENIDINKAIEIIGGSDDQTGTQFDLESKAKSLLGRIYSLTDRNRELMENALVAVDLELRLYFSDKKLIDEMDAAVPKNECICDLRNGFEAKKLCGEFGEKIAGTFCKQRQANPESDWIANNQSSVEISDLIKGIYDDLAYSCAGRVKLKDYSVLRKAITEYRNKHSFYVFDPKGFSKRKR